METDNEELKDQSPEYECMNLLFEFLNALVELKPSILVQLHEKLVKLSLNWVQNGMVCSKALALLKTITFNFPQNLSSETLQNLCTHVPLFLQLLQNNCTQTMTFNEHCIKLCALLQMLRALLCSKEVMKSVVDYLNEENVKSLLLSMTKNEEVLKYAETNAGVEFCMSALALVAELSQHDDSWYGDYQQIIKQK